MLPELRVRLVKPPSDLKALSPMLKAPIEETLTVAKALQLLQTFAPSAAEDVVEATVNVVSPGQLWKAVSPILTAPTALTVAWLMALQ